MGTVSIPEVHAATARAVAGIEASQNPTVAGNVLVDFANVFGLTHVICFALPLGPQSCDQATIFHATPRDFAKTLFDDAEVYSDAMLAQLQAAPISLRWDEVTASGPSGLRDAMCLEGMTNGLAVPLMGASGLSAFMLLGGIAPVLDDFSCALLKTVSVSMFARFCVLQRDALREAYGLSEREFECMKWVAAGKTDWEIGQILEISHKTVNYHVENAKRKFKVPTRVQAVVAAITSGGVKPD